MNVYAIRAIYLFELARTWRTLLQSIATPVISTSLYFVVFGSAIGARMEAMHGIPYGAFIIPGLIMMALLSEHLQRLVRHLHAALLGDHLRGAVGAGVLCRDRHRLRWRSSDQIADSRRDHPAYRAPVRRL